MNNGLVEKSFDDETSDWVRLGSNLWSRTHQPFRNPTFVIYFLISMIIGGIGIWIALIESLSPSTNGTLTPSITPEVFQSTLTFFAAVGSISCVQILITEDEDKHLRSLFVLFLILFVILAVTAAFGGSIAPRLPAFATVFGLFFAAVSWWIANWDDRKFSQTSAQAPLGGSPDDDAAGDTEGFTI